MQNKFQKPHLTFVHLKLVKISLFKAYFLSCAILFTTSIFTKIIAQSCPAPGCISTEDILVGEWGSDCIKLIDRNTGTSSNWQCTGINNPNFMIQIGDSIYVNNATPDNITAYDLNGTFLGVVASGFPFPEQMRIGPDGLLYIADQTLDDILAFDISAIPWTQSYVVDNNFNAAHGLDFDAAGNLYVSNNGAPNTLTRFNGPPPYSSTNTTVITTESSAIRGMATGPDGNIYFLVNANPQVVKTYDTTTGTISTFVTLDAGSGVFSGVHWGPDGQFYLSDFGESEVTQYDPNGNLVNVYSSGLSNPHTIIIPVIPSTTSCSVTGNNLLCAGQNLVLQENGGAAVEWCWEGPNGFSATTPSITINNISTAEAGTYTVVITDASGCVSEPCVTTVTVSAITATATAIQPSCTNGVSNNDGFLQLSSVTGGDRVNSSIGNTYSGDTNYANAITIGALPFQFNTGLSNPNGSQDYTIRVFNGGSECYHDVVVTMNELICPKFDLGDLPDTGVGTGTLNYETVFATSGPSHQIITGLNIGSIVDDETDGQQSADALGDGTDEDGFNFPTTLAIVPGGILNLPIDVVNTTGTTSHYEIWIDWNSDGDFNDPNEMVADLSDDGMGNFGQPYLTVNVPINVTTDQLLGFRARLSHTDNMTPNGQVDAGEVEDYLIIVNCKTEICLPIMVIKN